MALSNEQKWLLALKDGDVGMKEINRAIKDPADFGYDKSRGEHAVFHMILQDLDALCRKGEAKRAFERLNEAEVSEIYRITPAGRQKAKELLKGQGHQK